MLKCGRIGSLKDAHAIVPGAWAYVALHDRRGFTDVRLWTLGWREYFQLSWWIRCNHKGPYKWKSEAEVWIRGGRE